MHFKGRSKIHAPFFRREAIFNLDKGQNAYNLSTENTLLRLINPSFNFFFLNIFSGHMRNYFSFNLYIFLCSKYWLNDKSILLDFWITCYVLLCFFKGLFRFVERGSIHLFAKISSFLLYWPMLNLLLLLLWMFLAFILLLSSMRSNETRSFAINWLLDSLMCLINFLS